MERPRRPVPPQPMLALGRARSIARKSHDWAEADRLKAEIEAAGWRVIDRGGDFTLRPAHPPDVAEGDRVRYGSSESVPVHPEGPATASATIVVVASGLDRSPERLATALEAATAIAPPAAQVLAVLDDPDAAEVDAVEGWLAGQRDAGVPADVVLTSARLGPATCVAAGLRRASGRIVVLLESSAFVSAELIAAAVAALDDPAVAVSGADGLVSARLPRFRSAGPGSVDAIDAGCLAFRRDDVARQGPIDEHYRSASGLARWLSLALRDMGGGQPPRDALAIAGPEGPDPRDLDRRPTSADERRDAYRLLDAYGDRSDLISG